jgi:hypothetical protein
MVILDVHLFAPYCYTSHRGESVRVRMTGKGDEDEAWDHAEDVDGLNEDGGEDSVRVRSIGNVTIAGKGKIDVGTVLY